MIRYYLNEGGLKLPPEHRKDITPEIVLSAAKVYETFMEGFNVWLMHKGLPPVELIRPVGSSSHAGVDHAEGRKAVYGDIDYLVSFPVEYEADDDVGARRVKEKASSEMYIKEIAAYIRSEKPGMIDAEMTVKSNPYMVIVKVDGVGLVQVDTIITHPDYKEWMKGRYNPERGVKGYVTGNLYKALGDYFTMTIGTEGVLVRTKAGKRVPSSVRAGVSFSRISSNFKTFFKDIADYIMDEAGEPNYTPDPILLQRPGMNPDNVTVDDLARGIVGLARTLSSAGVVVLNEMLSSVYDKFVAGMDDNVGKKVDRGIGDDKQAYMIELNKKQAQKVAQIFGIRS